MMAHNACIHVTAVLLQQLLACCQHGVCSLGVGRRQTHGAHLQGVSGTSICMTLDCVRIIRQAGGRDLELCGTQGWVCASRGLVAAAPPRPLESMRSKIGV